MKYYLGYRAGKYHLFRAESEPTQETHGNLYDLVWGAFRTKRGAVWAQKYGTNNPHAQTVSQCERLAKESA
jgi:hypothetical protein